MNITIAPVAVQTGRHRITAIPKSDYKRVVGRISGCSRLRSSFRASFSVRGCVRGVGLARLESADLRRVDPCDALRRPVPRQALAVLGSSGFLVAKAELILFSKV